MDANYSFAIDRPLGLIRIVMTGLFTVEDVAGFLAARREAHAALGCAPNRHLTLNDVREMKIQPQETVAAFHSLLADTEYRSRRLAFVVSATLARSQLMRALAGRDSRCFDDPLAAQIWLLEDRWEAKADADAGTVLPFRRVA
jgi:hypothetical protein